MATDNSFIPLDNPDFTTFDPTTIGVDSNITPEAITSKSQPLAFDSDTGVLNINRNVVLSTATIGDPDIVAHFTHPNIPGELVLPQCQIGGTLYSNNVIIGSSSAQLLCDDTGTYIYNNLFVSGNINNNNLTTALNSKATATQLSNLTSVVSNKADQTDLITNYYNKNQTDSLLQGKANSNNVYTKSQVDSELSQKANATDLINKANVNDVYSKSNSDLLFQTKADMSNYPQFSDLSSYVTSGSVADITSTSSIFLSLTGASNTYQTIANMSSYVTTGTLIDNYATQLDISTKVEQAFFESSILALNQSIYNNAVVYTNNQITSLTTVYQPLGSYQLSGNYLTNASLFQLSGNYLTDSSAFQLAGNYLTNASLFQLAGNYLTNASAFQLAGNYLTNASAFQLAGNYLTDASAFQIAGNYLTNASLFQLSGNYLTNASVFQLAGNYLTDSSVFQLAGNYLTNASAFQLAGNYLTDASVFQLAGNYATSDSLTAYQPVANMATYITSGSLTAYQPVANMATYITSGSLTAYQSIANMATYITSGSLTAYQPVANMTTYITSGSLSAYQPVANMTTYITSGSLTAYQPVANMATYITSGSLSAYAPIASPSFTGTVSGITPTMIGLNNVRPWVAGYISSNGTSVNNSGVGQYNATVSRAGAGLYTLSFPTVAPKGASNLTCIWSPNTSGNFVVAMNNGNSQSTATVMIRDSTNTAVDSVVSFVIWCSA